MSRAKELNEKLDEMLDNLFPGDKRIVADAMIRVLDEYYQSRQFLIQLRRELKSNRELMDTIDSMGDGALDTLYNNIVKIPRNL